MKRMKGHEVSIGFAQIAFMNFMTFMVDSFCQAGFVRRADATCGAVQGSY